MVDLIFSGLHQSSCPGPLSLAMLDPGSLWPHYRNSSVSETSCCRCTRKGKISNTNSTYRLPAMW